MLSAGETAVTENDGSTSVTLVRDVTDRVNKDLPPHQRYWVVETLSGARRLALVHKGERVMVMRRSGLSWGLRDLIDGVSAEEDPSSAETTALYEAAVAKLSPEELAAVVEKTRSESASETMDPSFEP